MADYIKGTDFAAKDTLVSGDPDKVVKGTEIDDEFSAIQAAVQTKLDVTGDTITGTIAHTDGVKNTFGTGGDLEIFHNNTDNVINNVGTADLLIQKGGVTVAEVDSAGVSVTGNIAVSGTVDGRDVATDGTKLDALDQGVATTDSPTFAALDVNGTATMDGLTVDGGTVTFGGEGIASAFLNAPEQMYFNVDSNNTPEASGFGFGVGRTGSTGGKERLTINGDGDISFYEDTGTTAKFFWDASAESLGIGTSNPSRTLHLENSSGNLLRLNNPSTANGSYSLVEFTTGGGANNQIRSYQEDATNSYFSFYTKDSGSVAERMRIDSSGNVGIGTSSPAAPLDIGTTNSRIFLSGGAATVGGQYLYDQSYFNIGTLKSSGAPYIGYGVRQSSTTDNEFVSDTAVGIGRAAISVGFGGSGNITFSTGSGETTAAGDPLVNMTERMRIDSSGNLLVGGTTSPADSGAIVASGGVYLGGTGAANKLDDYEEGTWTPSAGTFASFSNASYTKVGNVVHIRVLIQGTGSATAITGLPFTPDAAYSGSLSIGFASYATITDSGDTPFVFRVKTAPTEIGIFEVEGTGATATLSGSSSITRILLEGTYYTTA